MTAIDTLEIPGHSKWTDRERFVFQITPNRADDIYIADNAPYETCWEELFKEIEPRYRLTDTGIAEAERARARTIVPISEYAGGYMHPVVLVGRGLDFDEVELVSGPWPEYQYVLQIANRDPEAKQLLEQALSTLEGRCARSGTEARDHFETAVQKLVNHFGNDKALIKAAKDYSRAQFQKVEAGTQFIGCIVSAAGVSRSLGLL